MKKNVFENSLYQFMLTFSNLVIVSVLWLFTSIPVVTAGASTAAMYYAIVKVIRKDTGTLYKEYFRAFKINFIQCLIAGILYSLYGIIMIMDCYNEWYGGNYYTLSSGIWFFVLVILMTLAAYLFPVISRFRYHFITILYLSVSMLVKNIVTSIKLLFLMLAGVIAIWIFPPVFVIVPGILFYTASFLLEPVLEKHSEFLKNHGSQE